MNKRVKIRKKSHNFNRQKGYSSRCISLQTLQLFKFVSKEKRSMENHQNEDSRVWLYLTTQKPLIYAGQYLQGTAHVQILEDIPYQSINLSIVGKEKIQWAQAYQKLLLSHKNVIETYRQELVLEQFQNGLKKGQYSFPFNILIPGSLPASMKIDENNYIAYYLTVYLPPYDNQSSKQAFQLSLHIREPLRSIFKTVTQGTKMSKCCGCFDNQESGLFHIQVDMNQIHYTNVFKVRVIVDNTKGKFAFDRIALTLMRRVMRVSDSGGVKTVDEQVGVFYKSKQSLSTGRKKKFEIDLTLPARIIEYTAIGNIISRCYFVCLIGEVGCCYNDTKIEKHMILNNQVPPEDWQKMKQVKHQNWNPQTKPPMSFVTLKPYIYNPASQIEPLNQRGNVLASTIINMQMSAKNLYRTE